MLACASTFRSADTFDTLHPDARDFFDLASCPPESEPVRVPCSTALPIATSTAPPDSEHGTAVGVQ